MYHSYWNRVDIILKAFAGVVIASSPPQANPNHLKYQGGNMSDAKNRPLNQKETMWLLNIPLIVVFWVLPVILYHGLLCFLRGFANGFQASGSDT